MSRTIINSPYHLEFLKALVQLEKKESHIRTLTYNDKSDIERERKGVKTRSLDRIFSKNCKGNFQEETTLTELCSWLKKCNYKWDDFIKEHPSPFIDIPNKPFNSLGETWREKIQLYIDSELRPFRNYQEYENRKNKTVSMPVSVIQEKDNSAIKQFSNRIYIELITRKAAIPIDEEKDLIIEIYNSWYKLFCSIREEMKTIPSSYFKDIDRQESVVKLSLKLLNDILRPHLTEHQAKFRAWFEGAKQNPKNKNVLPQELQKKYTNYGELIASMKQVNTMLIDTSQFIRDSI